MRPITALLALTLLGALSSEMSAQEASSPVAATPAPASETSPSTPAPVPFAVGEVMTYKMTAKCCLVLGGSGEASLRVEAIDTVRGHPTYRLVFQTRGGLLHVYNLNNVERSWLDVNQLFSRRFEQKHNSTRDGRDRTLEFLPDEMRYVDEGNPEDAGDLASARPLDDVSFIYHVRTLPLTMNRDYTEPRYYRSSGNPVTVQVLRTERVRVPAGEFDAIVVRPIIRTNGLFKEGGQAEVWITNDERRLIVKLRAKAGVGTLTMELQSFTLGTAVRSW